MYRTMFKQVHSLKSYIVVLQIIITKNKKCWLFQFSLFWLYTHSLVMLKVNKRMLLLFLLQVDDKKFFGTKG